jgi:hypothetical protein
LLLGLLDGFEALGVLLKHLGLLLDFSESGIGILNLPLLVFQLVLERQRQIEMGRNGLELRDQHLGVVTLLLLPRHVDLLLLGLLVLVFAELLGGL